jgi:hypothetical protein
MPRSRMVFSILVLSLVTLGPTGCKPSLIPSGFWLRYSHGALVERKIDQGPWGGMLGLRWVAARGSSLTKSDARGYAEANGWKFIDEQPSVLQSPPPDHRKRSASSSEPEFLTVPSRILRFDSGWLRENPGTGETSPSIGYVQVADDGSQMYVFHFWGNG